jgi:peptidylprolyl isomerase
MRHAPRVVTAALLLATTVVLGANTPGVKPRTMADVIGASKSSDWRSLDPQNTLYVELPTGRVIIELNPTFAPNNVTNIRTLVRGHYFDGLAIVRAQDDFVVQWADPDHTRPLGGAEKTLGAEFSRSANELPFTVLPDPDTYAPEVGFVNGFAAARDPHMHLAWLVHCYAAVGVGRDNDVDSGNGSELYVVIGHAPRQLDRNITLVGRVVYGMELLSSVKRGTGELGFYEKPSERTPIQSIRLAADVPEAQRTAIELLRTDTATFTELIEVRRNRRDEWYKVPAGRIDVCNVPLVARKKP